MIRPPDRTSGVGRIPFAGNRIPQSRIDPGIAAVIATGDWPNPNVPGTGAYRLARNYLSAGNNGQSQNQWDTKLNWNPNNKFSMFARFGINDNSWFNPQQYGPLGGPGFSPSNSAVGTGGGHIYSGTLSATYIFSPNLIADAYYGYSRNDPNTAQQRLNENLGWTVLGIPGLQSSQLREGGWPALMIDGFGAAGVNLPESTLGPYNNFQPQVYQNLEKEWAGNVTWIKGSHNVRMGLDFDQQQDNENQMQATFCTFCTGAGGFQFSQGTTQVSGGPSGNDFNAFASFLLRTPDQRRQSLALSAPVQELQQHSGSLCARPMANLPEADAYLWHSLGILSFSRPAITAGWSITTRQRIRW